MIIFPLISSLLALSLCASDETEEASRAKRNLSPLPCGACMSKYAPINCRCTSIAGGGDADLLCRCDRALITTSATTSISGDQQLPPSPQGTHCGQNCRPTGSPQTTSMDRGDQQIAPPISNNNNNAFPPILAPIMSGASSPIHPACHSICHKSCTGACTTPPPPPPMTEFHRQMDPAWAGANNNNCYPSQCKANCLRACARIIEPPAAREQLEPHFPLEPPPSQPGTPNTVIGDYDGSSRNGDGASGGSGGGCQCSPISLCDCQEPACFPVCFDSCETNCLQQQQQQQQLQPPAIQRRHCAQSCHLECQRNCAQRQTSGGGGGGNGDHLNNNNINNANNNNRPFTNNNLLNTVQENINNVNNNNNNNNNRPLLPAASSNNGLINTVQDTTNPVIACAQKCPRACQQACLNAQLQQQQSVDNNNPNPNCLPACVGLCSQSCVRGVQFDADGTVHLGLDQQRQFLDRPQQQQQLPRMAVPMPAMGLDLANKSSDGFGQLLYNLPPQHQQRLNDWRAADQQQSSSPAAAGDEQTTSSMGQSPQAMYGFNNDVQQQSQQQDGQAVHGGGPCAPLCQPECRPECTRRYLEKRGGGGDGDGRTRQFNNNNNNQQFGQAETGQEWPKHGKVEEALSSPKFKTYSKDGNGQMEWKEENAEKVVQQEGQQGKQKQQRKQKLGSSAASYFPPHIILDDGIQQQFVENGTNKGMEEEEHNSLNLLQLPQNETGRRHHLHHHNATTHLPKLGTDRTKQPPNVEEPSMLGSKIADDGKQRRAQKLVDLKHFERKHGGKEKKANKISRASEFFRRRHHQHMLHEAEKWAAAKKTGKDDGAEMEEEEAKKRARKVYTLGGSNRTTTHA